MHKLPKKKRPRRSHYKTEQDWLHACFKYDRKCGARAEIYLYKRDEREVLKSCQRTQRRAQKLQGTPLSASRALCPIVIPVNIIPGAKLFPETMGIEHARL